MHLFRGKEEYYQTVVDSCRSVVAAETVFSNKYVGTTLFELFMAQIYSTDLFHNKSRGWHFHRLLLWPLEKS